MDLKAMMSKLQASARPSTTPPATPSPPLVQQQQQQPQQPPQQQQYPPQFAQPMQMQMQMPPGVPVGQPLSASTEGQNPPWPFGQAYPAFNQNQGGAGAGLSHPHAHPYAMGFPPQQQPHPQQPGQIPQQQQQQQQQQPPPPHFMYPGFVPPPGVFPPPPTPGFAAGAAGHGPAGGLGPVQTNGVPLNNSNNNIPASAPSPAPSESHSHLLKMLRNSSSNQSSGSVTPQTTSAAPPPSTSSSSGPSTPSPPPSSSNPQTSNGAPLPFSSPAPSSLMFGQQSFGTAPGSPSSTVSALTSKLALLQQKGSLPSLSSSEPGSPSPTSPVKSVDLFSNYRKLEGTKANSNAKNKEIIKKTVYTVEDEETEWPSVICENISRTKLDRAVPISVNRQYLCFAVQPSKLRVFLRNSQLTLLINFDKIITDLQFIESSNFLIVSLVDGELQMLRLKSDSQHTEIKYEIMGIVRLEKKTPFKRILLCGSSSKFGVLTDENIFVMSFNPHNLIGAQSSSNTTSLITVDSNYAFETTVVDASFNESGNVFVSLANQRLISFSNPTEPNLLLESPTLIETVICLPQKILLTASEGNQSIQLYRYDDQVDNVQHLQELNFLPSPTRRLIVSQKQSNLLLVCNAYDSVLMILDLNGISTGEMLLSRFHFAGKILSAVEVLDSDDIHLYVSNGEGLTMCKFSLKDCTLVPSSPSSSSSSSSSYSSLPSSGSVAALPATPLSKLSGSVDSSIPAQHSGIPLSLLNAFNAAKKESSLSASHDGSVLGPITSISQLLSSTSATFSSSSLPVLPPVSASSISLASLESAFSPAPAPALSNEVVDQSKTISDNGSDEHEEEEEEEEEGGEVSDTESLSHQGQDASQDSSDEPENVHATNDPSGHDDPNEYEAERLAFRKASGLDTSSPLQQPLPTPLLDMILPTSNTNNAGGDDNGHDHQGSEETEANKKLKKSFDPTSAYNKSSFVDNDLFVATFQTPLSECVVDDHDTPFEPQVLAQIEEIPVDTASPSKRKNKRSKKKRSVSPTPSVLDEIQQQQQQHHHHHHHHAADDHQQEKEEDEAIFTKGFRVGFVPATLQFPEGYDPSPKPAKTNTKPSAKNKPKSTTTTNNTFSSASHSSNAAPEEPKKQAAASFSLSDTIDDIPLYAQSPRFQSGTFGDELTKSIEYNYDNSREASPTPPSEEKPKTPAKKNAKNKQQPLNSAPTVPVPVPVPVPVSGATTPKKKTKTPSTPAVPPVSPTPQPKTKKAKNKTQADATTSATNNKPGSIAPVSTSALPLKTKAKATSGTGVGAPQKSPRPEAAPAWTPVAAAPAPSSSGFALFPESSSSSLSIPSELTATEISAQQKIISQISQSVADRLYTRLDGDRKKATQKSSAPKDDLKAFLTESIANHTEPVMKAYFDQLIQSTLNSPETTNRIDRMVSMAFDRARGAVNATIQQRTARLNAMISSQIQNLYASAEGPSSPASSSSSSSTTYQQSVPSSSTFSSSGGVYFGNSTPATPKPQSSVDPSTNPVLSFLSKHGTNGQAIASSSSSSAQRPAPRSVQAPSSPLDCRSLELRLSTEPPVETPKPSYSDALYDALSQRDLKSVVALCEQIWDPQWVFGGREDVDAPPAVLERMNGISLALLSQLSFDLHDKTDLKLKWIAAALKKVKLTSSPKTLDVLEKVKAGANNVVRSFHSASPQTQLLAITVLNDLNTLAQPRH